MKTTSTKQLKIKGVVIIFTILTIPLLLNLVPKDFNNRIETNDGFNLDLEDANLRSSLPSSNYEWWNNTWTFRVPVSITANGSQQEAPVELFINFTYYFQDINVQNPILNISTIRVIEYLSASNYFEVDSQFDPYMRTYDNQTNAIGDLIWILNGTTNHGVTRDFFIYFYNGSTTEIPEPNYDTIRLWHEGFEEFRAGDILRPTDGQDNSHPNFWEISNTTAARGSSALKIWGNCWKVSATGSLSINSDTRVTAKMRFDDPSIVREISGIGFHTTYLNIPNPVNSYNIRGNQVWGSAGSYKFRNQYYAANTFFWYTFELDTEISLSSFSYIFYVADDDSYSNLNLYWDDISIWAKPVQTTPNNSLQTALGDIQPISFTLKVSCKDEEGFGVPNAHIFITNDLDPSQNQDHLTDETGEWIFSDIEKDGLYNITVNYTQQGLNSPITETVYYYNNYLIATLDSEVVAFLNLTKIDFDVSDKDGAPIQYGYVTLKDGSFIDVGKAILSDSGLCTIRWINNTNYNYNVHFDYSSLPDISTYIYDDIEIATGTVNIGNHDVSVPTEITKLNLNVTQYSDGDPFIGAKLRFYNTTDYNQESKIIANVTVQSDGTAKFISFSNETTSDWGNYTFDIYFAGSLRTFYVNDTYYAEGNYNFTLNQELNLNVSIDLNVADYNTTISFIDITTNIYWKDNVTIGFNFTKREPTEPVSTLVTPTELYFQILDEEQSPYSEKISILSSEISPGIFNFEFNTTVFSLVGGNRYWIEITGNYKSFVPPESLLRYFEVQSLPTGIRYYDYNLNELSNKKISAIYLETTNVTLNYFDYNTNISLTGAYITYSWDYGSGTLSIDPIHLGFYYFEFDTSLAPSDAEYIIDIAATLQNYSVIEDTMIINILARPTTINGTSTLFQLSPKIYILESELFNFEYEDSLLDVAIGNLDVASYNWYKLDENGNPLSGSGNEGSGNLIETTGSIYTLDFDTETREAGEYTIFITLQKNNYEVRNAFLSLEIKYRPLGFNLSATGLSGAQINVVQGTDIYFRLTLYDVLNQSQLLTGATVYIIIDANNHTLNEVAAGVYEFSFSTRDINTFLQRQILNAEITMEMQNYETSSINLNIVVGMTEIFPGFPLFYFLIIVGAVAAVAGSLMTYRTIQKARIPTFVKKVRGIKNLIKGKKSISESLLYPTKEEFIVKKLGDKWDLLGLSLEEILGIQGKKGKKLPEYINSEGGVM